MGSTFSRLPGRQQALFRSLSFRRRTSTTRLEGIPEKPDDASLWAKVLCPCSFPIYTCWEETNPQRVPKSHVRIQNQKSNLNGGCFSVRGAISTSFYIYDHLCKCLCYIFASFCTGSSLDTCHWYSSCCVDIPPQYISCRDATSNSNRDCGPQWAANV